LLKGAFYFDCLPSFSHNYYMYTSINFNSLAEALKTFEDAIATPPKSDLERDGIIQRFECTFEHCWKFILTAQTPT